MKRASEEHPLVGEFCRRGWIRLGSTKLRRRTLLESINKKRSEAWTRHLSGRRYKEQGAKGAVYVVCPQIKSLADSVTPIQPVVGENLHASASNPDREKVGPLQTCVTCDDALESQSFALILSYSRLLSRWYQSRNLYNIESPYPATCTLPATLSCFMLGFVLGKHAVMSASPLLRNHS